MNNITLTFSFMNVFNFVFGIVAIFLYVGIEVGIPNTVNLYLTTQTKEQLKQNVVANNVAIEDLTTGYENVPEEYVPYLDAYKASKAKAVEGLIKEKKLPANPTIAQYMMVDKASEIARVAKADKSTKEEALVKILQEENKENLKKINNPDYQEGKGMDTSAAGAIVGFYWLLMLIGRLVGGVIGGKVSSRAMVATVSAFALLFLSLGILLPDTFVKFPSVTSELSFAMTQIPLGVVFFVLCGLCTSVMWGAIFNLAVEGLGKYTSIASGLFMVMVCGGGILPFVQGLVADGVGFMPSFWVLVVAVAFILWYALYGSKVVKRS